MGFEDVVVTSVDYLGPEYQRTWTIEYRGYYQSVSGAISLNGAGLSGGVGSPSVAVATRRAYSRNLLFSVDYRFSGLPSSKPGVKVTTNGVPSVCSGSCEYTFNNWFEVTALSQ